MIAYIQGTLTHKSPALVHIEANGIGYEVQISLHTYSRIQHLQECKLLTYLHIKEEAHTLYGFFEEGEREVFLHLIGVSGIGAATARMMLSSLPPDEIIRAIVQENEKLLESIKGIGGKTAKRLILELRDKLSRRREIPQIAALANNTLQEDALNALVALGISRSMAEQAISKIIKAQPALNDLELLIKQSLKNL